MHGFREFSFLSSSILKPSVIEHYSICNLARYRVQLALSERRNRLFPYTPPYAHGEPMKLTLSSCVLQFSAYSYNLTTSDVFTTLIYNWSFLPSLGAYPIKHPCRGL
jgi:hypothetical protein